MARIHFAAAVWHEGMSSINVPALLLLCAKSSIGKIVLISCIGNYMDIKNAPRIRPGAVLNFTGIHTKKYSDIIMKIKNGELVNVSNIYSSANSQNIMKSYVNYSHENGLNSDYAELCQMSFL